MSENWDRLIGGNDEDIVGDTNVNGTLVLTFNIAAGKKLAIMHLHCHSNAALTVFELITGSIAAPTIIASFVQTAAMGGVEINKDLTPVLVIDNSAGGAVLAVIIRMPQQFATVANNPVTTYGSASVWGIEF